MNLANLEAVRDDSLEGIHEKQRLYEQTIRSSDYLNGRFLADSWCAAFVWKKTNEFNYPITEEVFRRIEHNPLTVDPWMRSEIQRLASQYQFFHWHLAFPDVFQVPASGVEPENKQTGWNGGFDCVLGNPPWERIQPEALQFFSRSHPELLSLKRDDRNKAIERLSNSDSTLYLAWTLQRQEHLNTTTFLKFSGRYPLSTTKNVNSYAVFSELTLNLVRTRGYAGLVLQSGIATDEINKDLFKELMTGTRIVSCYDFENRLGLFPSTVENRQGHSN